MQGVFRKSYYISLFHLYHLYFSCAMKNLTWVFLLILFPGLSYAQHVFPIKADSVRIYNVCDTAELIIENRTQDTLGFLYNKGNGRTEFRKLKLKDVGGGKLAIVGQDTINIAGIVTRSVDTLWRNGDSISYRINNLNYSVFAPMTLGKLSDVLLTSPANGQLLRYNLPLNKWENWTFADTMLGRGTPMRFQISPFKQAVIGGNTHYDSVSQYSVSIGGYAMARGNSSVALGYSSKVFPNSDHSIAIGNNSDVMGDSAIVIGFNSHISGSGAVGIGTSVISSSPRSLSLGYFSKVFENSEGAIAIGNSANATGPQSVAVGSSSRVVGENSVAIGYNAAAINQYAVAIGINTRASGQYSVAIGNSAIARAPGSMALFTTTPGSIQDSANVANGFHAVFTGGYELYTDADFSLKQYSSEKGKVFFRSNKTTTSVGAAGTVAQNSRLNVNGSLALPLKKVSVNYTLTSADYSVIALSGVVLTLGGGSEPTNRTFVLKNASDANITVNTNGVAKIKRLNSDTAVTYTLTSGSNITVQNDGTDWWIIK